MELCSKIEKLKERIGVLQNDMHSAPMNKVFTTHEGHRHLGTHSMEWAVKSREWAEAKRELEAMLSEVNEAMIAGEDAVSLDDREEYYVKYGLREEDLP